MRRRACWVLFFSGGAALKYSRFNVSHVECVSGASATCRKQCTSNGCYASKRLRDVNHCLSLLDEDCQVLVSGSLTVDLENHIDFCNVKENGNRNPGWLINVPYLGPFTYSNPTLRADVAERARSGDLCHYLGKTSSVTIYAIEALIGKNVCANNRDDEDRTMISFRDMDDPEHWSYPLIIHQNMKALFVEPVTQSCWQPLDVLELTADMEDTFRGQSQIQFDSIIETAVSVGPHMTPL